MKKKTKLSLRYTQNSEDLVNFGMQRRIGMMPIEVWEAEEFDLNKWMEHLDCTTVSTCQF